MKALCVSLTIASVLVAQPVRPRILGISHVAISVSDLDKARAYYEGFLGFAEPFDLKNTDGAVTLAFVKVNDYQYIEVSPGLKPGDDRLKHVAFYTDDAEKMREYLKSRGVTVPDSVKKGRSGTLNFNITDPDGHTLEFVQYLPDSWAMQNKGQALPASRVSDHMGHAGILVGNAAAAVKFYGDVLGFQETYRGSSNGKVLSWIYMRVPDGEDYLEFMLYKDLPAPDKRGGAHHICLMLPNVTETLHSLQEKPYAKTYNRPMDIVDGVNRKRHLSLFDPDGTRTELMEPVTIDGKPAVPSTAPPPNNAIGGVQ